jgi:hypothetical protein
MVSGLLPVNQLITRAKAKNIIQRCIAQELQGNVIINSSYCPEILKKNTRAKMHVPTIAIALGYCPSLLLLCLCLRKEQRITVNCPCVTVVCILGAIKTWFKTRSCMLLLSLALSPSKHHFFGGTMRWRVPCFKL